MLLDDCFVVGDMRFGLDCVVRQLLTPIACCVLLFRLVFVKIVVRVFYMGWV